MILVYNKYSGEILDLSNDTEAADNAVANEQLSVFVGSFSNISQVSFEFDYIRNIFVPRLKTETTLPSSVL